MFVKIFLKFYYKQKRGAIEKFVGYYSRIRDTLFEFFAQNLIFCNYIKEFCSFPHSNFLFLQLTLANKKIFCQKAKNVKSGVLSLKMRLVLPNWL